MKVGKPFAIGTSVKVSPRLVPAKDWSAIALLEREAIAPQASTAIVLKIHTGHGLCYRVRFPDGTEACYDPDELEPLRWPKSWLPDDFEECAACRVKPGAPALCVQCLERRALYAELDKLLEMLDAYEAVRTAAQDVLATCDSFAGNIARDPLRQALVSLDAIALRLGVGLVTRSLAKSTRAKGA